MDDLERGMSAEEAGMKNYVTGCNCRVACKHFAMHFAVGALCSKKVMRAAEQQRPDVRQKRRWWSILVFPQFDTTGARASGFR